MSSDNHAPVERSYGCTFGCGNPYDFVFISVADGTTEFLCLPCMVELASNMVMAVTESEHPDVQKALADYVPSEQAPMRGSSVKRGRKNAPATTDDPDVIEAFSGVITADELPDEFK